MSYSREMTWIACMVAGDVTKYNKKEVRHMIEETSCDTVFDFFDAYRRTFDANVKKQLDYCLEIDEEMEE